MQTECSPPERSGRAKRFDWTRGYSCYCENLTYSEIALELGCSEDTVRSRANRDRWKTRRERLRSRLPAEARETHVPGVASDYLRVVEALARYVPDELRKLQERETKLTQDFAAAEPALRVKIAEQLDRIAERRRIVLNIPLPGSRRVAESRVKRAVASLPVIDVAPPKDGFGDTGAGSNWAPPAP